MEMTVACWGASHQHSMCKVLNGSQSPELRKFPGWLMLLLVMLLRLDVFAILFLLLPFQVCVTKFLGAQSHSHRDPDKKHVPDSYSGSIIVSFPLAMMNIS